jgi:hypothetical protein
MAEERMKALPAFLPLDKSGKAVEAKKKNRMQEVSNGRFLKGVLSGRDTEEGKARTFTNTVVEDVSRPGNVSSLHTEIAGGEFNGERTQNGMFTDVYPIKRCG